MALPETADSLLELLRANTDEFGWLQPLLDDPDSAALVGATVAIFGRLGPAVLHNRDAALISACSAGQHGTCQVTMTRAGGSSGTIPHGYPFVDQRGCRAITQTDVPVVIGQTTVVLQLETVRQTELVNTADDPGFEVAPDAPGVIANFSISNLIGPVGDPANGGGTFVAVASSTPIQGGAADYLTVHGDERGALRQTGETESDYRARIRNVPDAVSPVAVADVVGATGQVDGVPTFRVLEPFRDLATPALKELHHLGSFDTVAFDATPAPGNADFLDDDELELGDRRTIRAYFRVQGQDYARDVGMLAMFYEDGYYDDPIHGYADAWIGFPPEVLAGILSMLRAVQGAKAGGVNFDVYMRDPDVVYGVGATTSATLTQVFDLIAPAFDSWMIMEVTAGVDSPNPVPASAWNLFFTLIDNSTISIDGSGYGTVRVPVAVGKAVHRVQGSVKSDGSTAVNLVMTMRVHLMYGLY